MPRPRLDIGWKGMNTNFTSSVQVHLSLIRFFLPFITFSMRPFSFNEFSKALVFDLEKPVFSIISD